MKPSLLQMPVLELETAKEVSDMALGIAEIQREYPPEIQTLREGYQKLIADIQERIFSPPAQPQNAVMSVGNLRWWRPEEHYERMRQYHYEIDPIVRQLVDLDIFAKTTLVMEEAPKEATPPSNPPAICE